jgi:hypothetical protein
VAGRAEKVFEMPVADVYVLYERKIERKGGDVANLDAVITWLTGFDKRTIRKHMTARTSFRAFFKEARLNPKAKLITGSICGVKIQDIDDPLIKKVRYLDKLVDEVASGRPMSKVLRESATK